MPTGNRLPNRSVLNLLTTFHPEPVRSCTPGARIVLYKAHKQVLAKCSVPLGTKKCTLGHDKY